MATTAGSPEGEPAAIEPDRENPGWLVGWNPNFSDEFVSPAPMHPIGYPRDPRILS